MNQPRDLSEGKTMRMTLDTPGRMSSQGTVSFDPLPTNNWVVTQATVTSCRTAFSLGRSDDSYFMQSSSPGYILRFEYEANASHPAPNTASEFGLSWSRAIVWAIGAAIVGVAIYFKNR